MRSIGKVTNVRATEDVDTCGDICYHLGSIPKIDWFSCSVHVLSSISLMLLSASRFALITKLAGSSSQVLA